MRSIRWQFFPQYTETPAHLRNVIEVFKTNHKKIDSTKFNHSSNDVLRMLRADLKSIGYNVEERGIRNVFPILIGENNKTLKKFYVDAYHKRTKTIIEIEAGQAITSNNFMKDLLKACLIQDTNYIVISARIIYGKSNNKNFETIKNFISAIYASDRIKLPLKGCLVVGY